MNCRGIERIAAYVMISKGYYTWYEPRFYTNPRNKSSNYYLSERFQFYLFTTAVFVGAISLMQILGRLSQSVMLSFVALLLMIASTLLITFLMPNMVSLSLRKVFPKSENK